MSQRATLVSFWVQNARTKYLYADKSQRFRTLRKYIGFVYPKFYIPTDKLFQCRYSCFLKRVYIIHNLTFSWGVSPYYKTNYCTILKYKIAKPYSIIEESERFLALKWTTPGWRWCFLKMLSPVCFLAANGHFQLWLACLMIVASTSIIHF